MDEILELMIPGTHPKSETGFFKALAKLSLSSLYK